MRSVVALIETRPETVSEDYRRVLELAGLPSRSTGSPFLLLGRSRGSGFQPGFDTPPWQVDAMLSYLQAGAEGQPAARALPVNPPGAFGSGGPGKGGFHDDLLARRSAVPVPADERLLKPVKVAQPLPALAAVLPEGFRAPLALAGAETLVLASPVLEGDYRLAGCVALLADLLTAGARRRRNIPRSEVVAEALALARETAGSLGAVLDGVAWGVYREDGRPHPLLRNVVLAGRDPVAVDAVAARLAGLDPRRLPWLQLCAERGLGVVDRQKIVIKGRKDLLDLDFEFPKGTFAPGPGIRSMLTAPGRLLGTLGRRGVDGDFAATAWGRLLAAYRTGAVE